MIMYRPSLTTVGFVLVALVLAYLSQGSTAHKLQKLVPSRSRPVRVVESASFLEIEGNFIKCGKGVCPLNAGGVCCPGGKMCCPEKCVDVGKGKVECRFYDQDKVMKQAAPLKKLEAKVSAQAGAYINLKKTPAGPILAAAAAADAKATAAAAAKTKTIIKPADPTIPVQKKNLTPIDKKKVGKLGIAKVQNVTGCIAAKGCTMLAHPTVNVSTPVLDALRKQLFSQVHNLIQASVQNKLTKSDVTKRLENIISHHQSMTLALSDKAKAKINAKVKELAKKNHNIVIPENGNITPAKAVELVNKAALNSNATKTERALAITILQLHTKNVTTAQHQAIVGRLSQLATDANKEIQTKQGLLAKLRAFAKRIGLKDKVLPVPLRTNQGKNKKKSKGGGKNKRSKKNKKKKNKGKRKQKKSPKPPNNTGDNEEEGDPNVEFIEPNPSHPNFGKQYPDLVLKKDGNVCMLSGVVKSKVGSIATLPSTCSPKKGRITFTAMEGSNKHDRVDPVRVDITPDGKLWQTTTHTSSDGKTKDAWLSLAGVSYSVNAKEAPLRLEGDWKNTSVHAPVVYREGKVCMMAGKIQDGHWGSIASIPQRCEPDARVVLSGNNQDPIRLDVKAKSNEVFTSVHRREFPWISLSGSIWAQATGKSLTIDKSWKNLGNGYRPASYQKSGNKLVIVEGAIIPATKKTPSRKIAQLPAGFRPSSALFFGTNHGSDIVRIEVHPDGSIIWTDDEVAIGPKGKHLRWLNLGGIVFYADGNDVSKVAPLTTPKAKRSQKKTRKTRKKRSHRLTAIRKRHYKRKSKKRRK